MSEPWRPPAGPLSSTRADSRPRRAVAAALSRHSVALVSLLIALSGLAYNTWRNETSEAHRNVREAAFRALHELGEFQQIVDRRFYAADRAESTRIAAWGRIGLARDLGGLVSPASEASTGDAFRRWQLDAARIDEGDAQAEARLSAAVATARNQLIEDLRRLR